MLQSNIGIDMHDEHTTYFILVYMFRTERKEGNMAMSDVKDTSHLTRLILFFLLHSSPSVGGWGKRSTRLVWIDSHAPITGIRFDDSLEVTVGNVYAHNRLKIWGHDSSQT